MERTVVTVTLVDIDNMLCHVRDRTGGQFQTSLQQDSPAFQIPKVGEAWVAYRSNYTWHLRARVDADGSMRSDAQLLEEGDTTISTSGKLSVRAPGGMLLNGGQLGAPTRDIFTSDGGGVYLLSAEPVHPSSLTVHYGIAILHPHEYELEDRAITILDDFAPAIPITCSFERRARTWEDDEGLTMLLSATGDEVYEESP